MGWPIIAQHISQIQVHFSIAEPILLVQYTCLCCMLWICSRIHCMHWTLGHSVSFKTYWFLLFYAVQDLTSENFAVCQKSIYMCFVQKVVFVHAITAYRGSRNILSPLTSAPSTLPLAKNHGTHWIQDWLCTPLHLQLWYQQMNGRRLGTFQQKWCHFGNWGASRRKRNIFIFASV